ncbi:MAG: hypothetical protein BWY35_00091 [Firmicutes bacterium ADurb.Bin248]|nr:MAG: hypothetical protein BWY35_00091 [Firmicutes bacterium ADurb.Bin248]
MSNAVTPEMIRLLNSGDQRELRAFLTLYAKPVYDRAMAITGNETDARRVTRRVVSETALLAVKGALEEDVDAQLMKLTDACCSEDLFFARLVDETMQELSVRPAGEPDRLLPRAPAFAPEPPQDPPAQKKVVPAEAPPPDAAPAPREAPEAPPPLYVSDLAPAQEVDVPDLFAEEEAEAEAEGKKAGPLMVVLIFTLSLITIALVWVLLVKLMYVGAIPKFDFGFAEWFNAHMFKLY